jgi:hypothetical protein
MKKSEKANKEKKIKKGKVAIIKRDGKVIFTKIADKGLRIEAPESDEIIEKNKADLTTEEKGKFKNK